MNVWCISATCGRHKLMERSLRFFLDQSYPGIHTLLVYNNSEIKQRLSDLDLKWNQRVLLVNNHIDSETGQRYTNLGAIYRDALKVVPDSADIISHWDDDDIFLTNHIEEGIKGLIRAGKKMAYKPEKSWYRHPGGITLMGNNLEPSVFMRSDWLREYGYGMTTTDQHLWWFTPLLEKEKILIDPTGPPTLIYNWGDVNIPTFKTSGNAGHPSNFENYRKSSQDHGDQILTPWEPEEVKEYYNLVSNVKERQQTA